MIAYSAVVFVESLLTASPPRNTTIFYTQKPTIIPDREIINTYTL